MLAWRERERERERERGKERRGRQASCFYSLIFIKKIKIINCLLVVLFIFDAVN